MPDALQEHIVQHYGAVHLLRLVVKMGCHLPAFLADDDGFETIRNHVQELVV